VTAVSEDPTTEINHHPRRRPPADLDDLTNQAGRDDHLLPADPHREGGVIGDGWIAEDDGIPDLNTPTLGPCHCLPPTWDQYTT
jgi:hypothetical protein